MWRGVTEGPCDFEIGKDYLLICLLNSYADIYYHMLVPLVACKKEINNILLKKYLRKYIS